MRVEEEGPRPLRDSDSHSWQPPGLSTLRYELECLLEVQEPPVEEQLLRRHGKQAMLEAQQVVRLFLAPLFELPVGLGWPR
jgi:hypothetical protein